MSNSKAGRKYSIQLIFFLAVYSALHATSRPGCNTMWATSRCSTAATTMSVTWPIYNIIAPAEHDGKPPLRKVRDSGQGNYPNSIASMARLTGGYTLGLGPRHVRNLYCLSPQPLKSPRGPWTGAHGLGSYLNRSSPAPHESMTEPCCIAYRLIRVSCNTKMIDRFNIHPPIGQRSISIIFPVTHLWLLKLYVPSGYD